MNNAHPHKVVGITCIYHSMPFFLLSVYKIWSGGIASSESGCIPKHFFLLAISFKTTPSDKGLNSFAFIVHL